MAERIVIDLGQTFEKTDIKSSLGPFWVLQDYKVTYHESVIRALAQLYAEYNRAFGSLVAANREWQTDYQYCLGPAGPVNFAVQIDMVGLPDGFLRLAPSMEQELVREIVRRKIFEIENSLAMYQFLERAFYDGHQTSAFKQRWRTVLDALRQRLGRPVALLAVTAQKHEAMCASEFGVIGDKNLLSDADVLELSGFDRLFGPEDFLGHLEQSGGECNYLLYVRSSDPVAKLRRPELKIAHPLLDNREIRRVIKANALTFNIDDPHWAVGDKRRINDTKWYLPQLKMAFPIAAESDLYSPEFAAHSAAAKPYPDFNLGGRLSASFTSYLESFGADPTEVELGEQYLRFKPGQGTYGCYGHVWGPLTEQRIRSVLRAGLRRRGPYMVQPELPLPVLVNEGGGSDVRRYNYIDRVFMSCVGGKFRFLGGFRSLMPLDSIETHEGRNHGSKFTVYAEITD